MSQELSGIRHSTMPEVACPSARRLHELAAELENLLTSERAAIAGDGKALYAPMRPDDIFCRPGDLTEEEVAQRATAGGQLLTLAELRTLIAATEAAIRRARYGQ